MLVLAVLMGGSRISCRVNEDKMLGSGKLTDMPCEGEYADNKKDTAEELTPQHSSSLYDAVHEVNPHVVVR